MNSIIGTVKNDISYLQHSAANYFKYLQTSWTIVGVIHILQKIIYFLILLTLLGITIYILPVDSQ